MSTQVQPSVVSELIVRSAGLTVDTLSTRPLLTDTSHNLISCLGIVDVPVSLLGRTVRHRFTVIPYPGPLILLGHDFGSLHG